MTQPEVNGNQPTSRRPRFEHVDALRAFAALTVLSYHVQTIGPHFHMATAANGSLLGALATKQATGVAVFFVISGFVLYRPWVASRHGQGRRPNVGNFARRRFLRIMPAYWVALTVLTLAFSLPDVFTGNWWRYYGLLQVYDPHTLGNGMGVAWTLCIEVTFYALLPIYAAVADRVAPSAKRELVLLLALASVTWGWRALANNGVIDRTYEYTLLGTLDWFVAGMTLAVLSVREVRVPTRLALIACVLAFPALVIFPYHVPAGIFAAVLLSLAVLTPSPPRFLAWRPLLWLGTVSYGLYLWHATLIPPVIHHIGDANYATVLIGTVIVTTVMAAASYYAVERPLMRIKTRRGVTPKTGPSSRELPAAAPEPSVALGVAGE